MESALRPPLPTVTRSDPQEPDLLLNTQRSHFSLCGGPNPCPLDQSVRPKHHHFDPRKQTPGGRHQMGTPAGFKSETVADFRLECVAGFVGIRNPLSYTRKLHHVDGRDRGRVAGREPRSIGRQRGNGSQRYFRRAIIGAMCGKPRVMITRSSRTRCRLSKSPRPRPNSPCEPAPLKPDRKRRGDRKAQAAGAAV
jgi:hypothetical protein